MPTIREQSQKRWKEQDEREAQEEIELQKQLEEMMQDQATRVSIYQCEKCGFIIDEAEEMKKNAHYKDKPTPTKCPKCNGKLKKISKEEKEKALLRQKKEKQQEERTIKDVIDDVKNSTLDFLKELRDDLLNNKISPQRFVALFMRISFKIAQSRKREYSPDWLDYRKTMLDMCQNVMDTYDIKIDAEQAFNDYDFSDIANDSIYAAYDKKYNEGDKFAVNQEHMEQKREYESNKEALEKEKIRLTNAAEKAEYKQSNRLEKSFGDTLKNGVNKI